MSDERSIDIRVASAREKGFVLHEAGEIVAALSTAREVADWLQQRLEAVQPEVTGEVVDMPNVARRDATRSRSFMSRVRGNE
jgi:hypothetical protein